MSDLKSSRQRWPLESLVALPLVVIVLLASASINYYNIRRLHYDNRDVQHTYQVLQTLESIQSLAKDAETGQRGFLITSQDIYLEPYHGARKKIDSLVQELTTLTIDNASAQARLPALREIISRRLLLLDEAIRLHREQGLIATSSLLATHRGKDAMDELRRQIADFIAAERSLLTLRASTTERAFQTVLTTGLMTALLGMGLIVAYGILTQRMLRQRIRSTATLFRERELLQVTLSSIGDGVIVTDIHGLVTFLNPVAQELCGWTNESASGQPLGSVFKIVNESTREIVENPALRALAEGRIVGLANHTILISQTGSECAIADSAAPIRGIDGQLQGSVLVFRDVTVDREQEQALRRSEALNAGILKAALDAIITCDHEGHIIEFNPAAEQIFGYQREEILGRKLSESIIPQQLRSRHNVGMTRYLETGQPVIMNQRIELTAQRADGTIFPIEFVVAPIQGDGPPIFTAYLQDISTRKLAEQLLAERVRMITLSAEVSRLVVTAQELPEMLQLCTQAIARDVGAVSAYLWLRHDDEQHFVRYGTSDQSLAGTEKLSTDQSIIQQIAAQGAPYHSTSLDNPQQPVEPTTVSEQVTMAGYPLQIGEQLIGVLTIFSRQPLEQPTLEVLASIAEILAIGIDRRQVLRREQESRKLWQVTLASIGDAVLTTDLDGHITFLNEVAQQLTGCTPAEALGQPIETVFNIVNEHSGLTVENPVRRVLSEGAIVGLANHTILIAKDGAHHPIDDSGAPIRIGETMVGVVLVFRDVSEQKTAELLIRESEAELRRLADTMPQFVWVARPDGYLEYYNQKWYDYTGCSPSDCLGYKENIWIHPDDREFSAARWAESLSTGKNYEIERRLRSKSGEYAWFLGRAVPVRDQDGDILKWYGTSTDITERKQLEDHLRIVAADLSEANRLKNEFLATLAHELRNPLAPIRTGLELMKYASGDLQLITDTRNMMERQTSQMVRLIDDLLDVSRITQGKLQLRKARIELSEVIKSSVEAVQPFITEAGHSLQVTIPETPLYLDADPNRLAQVFSNLLSNASKYTQDHGEIQLIAQQDGLTVLIRVIDSGLGIPPEMQSRIFEMFAQIDRPMERGYTGLGIGLTLVKRLVEMHAGHVEVHSDGVGHGSEFTVRLPIVTEHAHAPSTPATASGQPVATRVIRILVVDDNKAAAETLQTVLKILGHQVFMAHDGAEAVAATELHQPEIVLMDLGMPKLNGFEAARQIRAAPWGQSVILIALTGWGQDEDRQRTRDAGFDDHLTKPADPAVLQTLLTNVERKR